MDNDKNKKVTIDYAKSRGVKFLQPDINKSDIEFKIEKVNGEKCIRYGFSKVKGLGKSIQYLVEVRELTGDFTDFDDFMDMLHNKEIALYINNYLNTGKKNCPVNSGQIKKLILCGAFDNIEPNRFALYNYYMEEFESNKKGKSKKKIEEEYKPFDIESYDISKKYALEVAYLGGYVSGHPLDKLPSNNISNLTDNQVVTIPMILNTKKVKKIGRGRNKGSEFLTIEFMAPNNIFYKANIFTELYEKVKDDIFAANLAKNIEKGTPEEIYERVLKEDKKRAKCLYMIKAIYSEQFRNFNILEIKHLKPKRKE